MAMYITNLACWILATSPQSHYKLYRQWSRGEEPICAQHPAAHWRGSQRSHTESGSRAEGARFLDMFSLWLTLFWPQARNMEWESIKSSNLWAWAPGPVVFVTIRLGSRLLPSPTVETPAGNITYSWYIIAWSRKSVIRFCLIHVIWPYNDLHRFSTGLSPKNQKKDRVYQSGDALSLYVWIYNDTSPTVEYINRGARQDWDESYRSLWVLLRQGSVPTFCIEAVPGLDTMVHHGETMGKPWGNHGKP